MSDPIVIVGAGQAAAQAVASLRSQGWTGGIVVFGDERHLPYQRPPLSKAFLAGETTVERLELKPASFYADLGVDLRTGVVVSRIDPAAHTVEYGAGETQPFSKLLIATGTRARRIALPGVDLAGVHHLRAIDDVEAFRAELRPGAKLVVLGGGYVGLETAAKARTLGLEVTVVEAAERILARVASEPTAALLAERHRLGGVEILTRAGVAAIEGDRTCTGVTLTDGRRLPADLVLIAVGAVPNQELAAEAGIEVGNGIVVDAATRTSAPDIHAAGDVACFPSRLYGRHLRLESVQNAIDQAKAAAAAMLGEQVAYDPVPWFWSDQFELKLQIAGLGQGYDHAEVVGDPAGSKLAVRLSRAGRLIAVESISDPRSHMLARRELAEAAAAAAV